MHKKNTITNHGAVDHPDSSIDKSISDPYHRVTSADTSENKNRVDTRHRPSPSTRKGKSRRSSKKKKVLTVSLGFIFILAALSIAFFIWLTAATGKKKPSPEVTAYKDTVEKYAAQYGLEDWTDIMLAIMQVESRGRGSDVMQSSESADLPVNSLNPEESIKQACVYLKELKDYNKYCDVDLDTIIQAYNYGPQYMKYVSKNGGVHTAELAAAFAKERSGGKKVRYLNPFAIRANGGWRYAYGNMFYVELVNSYLP